MTRFIRILMAIVRALLRSRTALLDESVLRLRVWPHEADLVYVHQAIYFLYMELGRWDLAIRSGLGRWMLRQRCAGIIGAQSIRYCRSLRRFQAFEVRTRVAGWDEKWFYCEQRLKSNDQEMTVGYVQLMFLDPEGNRVPPKNAVLACGGDPASPPLGDIPGLLAEFSGSGWSAPLKRYQVD